MMLTHSLENGLAKHRHMRVRLASTVVSNSVHNRRSLFLDFDTVSVQASRPTGGRGHAPSLLYGKRTTVKFRRVTVSAGNAVRAWKSTVRPAVWSTVDLPTPAA